MQTVEIRLEIIDDNPWQTRQAYDDEYIADLAADIQRNGLMQAPAGRLVYPDGKPFEEDDPMVLMSQSEVQRLMREHNLRVQLSFGHNRLRAFRHDGPMTMPVDLRSFTDEQMAILAWSENEQRKNLNPIEEALAIKRRMDDFKWNQQRAADELGLARATISNKLRVLDLPEERREQVRRGELSERKAMALLPVYQLPATVRNGLVKQWPLSEKWDKLSESSSEEIRQAVKQALNYGTDAFGKDHFLREESYDVDGVRQPACEGCSMLIARQGEPDRCADRVCFRLKAAACRRQRIESTARRLHLEVIDTSEIEFRKYDHFEGYNNGKAGLKKAEERRCDRLKIDLGRAYGISPPKCDGAYVCDHDGKGCACLRSVKRAETKAKNELQAAVDRIISHTAAQVAQLLASVPEQLIRAFHAKGLWSDSLKRLLDGEVPIEESRQAVANGLVEGPINWDDKESTRKLIKALQTWADGLGLDIGVCDPGPDAPAANEVAPPIEHEADIPELASAAYKALLSYAGEDWWPPSSLRNAEILMDTLDRQRAEAKGKIEQWGPVEHNGATISEADDEMVQAFEWLLERIDAFRKAVRSRIKELEHAEPVAA